MRRCLARNRLSAATACAVALASVLVDSAAVAQGPPPASVRVDAVRMETVQEHRLVTGELRAVRRAKVATEEPSLVMDVPVQEGQRVRKGDVLARLDQRRLEIELREVQASQLAAESAVDERRAETQWRKRDLESLASLSAGGASNPKELYDAQWNSKIAEAKLAGAERLLAVMAARAELLQRRIADTTIAAPFDGVVVSKVAEVGQWLAEGDTVIELVSSGPIDAWLDVPQQYADAIFGKTPSISIAIEATGETLTTSQLRNVPLIDPKARTFSLIARLDNARDQLAPGMSLTAWVPTGDSGERLTIHKDAVLRNDAGTFIYVARSTAQDAPSVATPVEVQVLFAVKDRFVVRSPALAAGDLAVVEGNERLFPMAPVIPVPMQQAANTTTTGGG